MSLDDKEFDSTVREVIAMKNPGKQVRHLMLKLKKWVGDGDIVADKTVESILGVKTGEHKKVVEE